MIADWIREMNQSLAPLVPSEQIFFLPFSPLPFFPPVVSVYGTLQRLALTETIHQRLDPLEESGSDGIFSELMKELCNTAFYAMVRCY